MGLEGDKSTNWAQWFRMGIRDVRVRKFGSSPSPSPIPKRLASPSPKIELTINVLDEIFSHKR